MSENVVSDPNMEEIDITEGPAPADKPSKAAKGEDETRIKLPKQQPYIIISPDAGEWFWAIISENGRILAVGGRGYATKHKAKEAIDNVISIAKDAATKIVASYELSGKGGEDEPK